MDGVGTVDSLSGSNTHTAVGRGAERRTFVLLVLFRCILASAALLALGSLIELGTPLWVLVIGVCSGVIGGSLLAFVPIRPLGFALLISLTGGLYLALTGLANSLPRSGAIEIFSLYSFLQHLDLVLMVAFIGAVSSWCFWRYQITVALEMVVLALVAVYLLSGHRDYRLDLPVFVNDLAWFFGIEQLWMFIWLGVALVSTLVGYLTLANVPSKPRPFARQSVITSGSRPQRLSSALLLGAFTVLLVAISNGAYRYFSSEAQGRTTNGVGQSNEEGLSPLSFHSALGSTNQPAALVRLENDYRGNPFSPMLFLRESALSKLKGNELVLADSRFDRETPALAPELAFEQEENPAFGHRTPLTQSVYLLADHKVAFAVDYPLSLTRLKNPNPSRFRGTYRAVSAAPSFTLEELRGHAVGDPNWSEEERQHYLEQHPDGRYTQLARVITENAVSMAEQPFLLSAFLSQQSIYTLTPNHNVPTGSDPVAAYLFGDMRGYCVHFAHAMVYMLRALGIPSRIGTGYLTDLSQARDGHILLRMSDRHAWAEVYVTGYGWVPFDVQPTQVESHADSEVDAKLLEELMGMIDPGEELLPDDIAADEHGMQEERWLPKVSGTALLSVMGVSLALFLLTKGSLLFGWALTRDPRRRLRRSTLALVLLLHDLGFRRAEGETLEGFRQRLTATVGVDLLPTTDALNGVRFANRSQQSLALREVDALRAQGISSLRGLFRYKVLLAALSPASLLERFFGRL